MQLDTHGSSQTVESFSARRTSYFQLLSEAHWLEKVSCSAEFEQVHPTGRRELEWIGDVCTGRGEASRYECIEPVLEFWVSILIASRELKRTPDGQVTLPEVMTILGIRTAKVSLDGSNLGLVKT